DRRSGAPGVPRLAPGGRGDRAARRDTRGSHPARPRGPAGGVPGGVLGGRGGAGSAPARRAAGGARPTPRAGAAAAGGGGDRRAVSRTASWAAVAARAPRPSAVRRVTPVPDPGPGPLRRVVGVIRRHRFALVGTAFAAAVITAAAFILVSAERPGDRVAIG